MLLNACRLKLLVQVARSLSALEITEEARAITSKSGRELQNEGKPGNDFPISQTNPVGGVTYPFFFFLQLILKDVIYVG